MPPLALYADVDAPFLESYCSDCMALGLAALCLLCVNPNIIFQIMTKFKMFCSQQMKLLQRNVTVMCHYYCTLLNVETK